MAEILAVASAGAGLLSLSIQLLESGKKLHNLYNDTRDAPNFLQDVSTDLELMGLMLHNFEKYRTQDDRSQDVLLVRCTDRIRSISSEIDTLTSELLAHLQRSKMRGRLRIVMKEPEIQRLLTKLERAKSSPAIAHQLYLECGLLRSVSALE